jgi:hypothetical protein
MFRKIGAMAQFTLTRTDIDSHSTGMRVQWATTGAAHVLIAGTRFPRHGKIRIPVRIGDRLTLTAIGRSGVTGEIRYIYLTPTFDGLLPLTARPVRPLQHYLAIRAVTRARALTAFRRMVIDLRVPRMRFGPSRPVRRTGLRSARPSEAARQIGALPGRLQYLPVTTSRAEQRGRVEQRGKRS